MIEIVYARRLLDLERFEKLLLQKGVVTLGVSETESLTYVHVKDDTTEDQKTIIDRLMGDLAERLPDATPDTVTSVEERECKSNDPCHPGT